jgi:hypothetical protein
VLKVVYGSEKWAKASTFIVLVGGMLTAGVTQVRLRESAPLWSRMETLTTSHRISHRRALGRDGALQERRRSPPGQSGAGNSSSNYCTRCALSLCTQSVAALV